MSLIIDGGEGPYLGGIDPTLYKRASCSAADDDSDLDDDDEGLDQVDGGRGLGSVRFGVGYQLETERLTVTLVRARNLPSRNPGTANACDPFVRFAVSSRMKYVMDKQNSYTIIALNSG